MPSPIGHSLLGFLIYMILNRHNNKYDVNKLFLCLFFANLPDIDIFLSFIINSPNLFHQSIVHSLGAAVLTGLIVGMLLERHKSFYNSFLFFFGLYYSHVILDYLASASDTAYPFGVALFWPLSHEYYVFPLIIFSDIWKGQSYDTFLSGLINLHNLWAVMIELVLLLPPIIILGLMLGKKRQI